MNKLFALSLIAILLVTGCQSSENAVNTATAQTQTAIPTTTATPIPAEGANKYMLEIVPLYLAYTDAYKVLLVYLQTATADPTTSWTDGYMNSTNDLQIAADKLSSLTPPAKEVETLDQLTKRLSRETTAMISHMNSFYLEGNLNEADLALKSIENIRIIFGLMNDEIEKNT
jgi:hypothetical protein